jgi:hypothetical protein
MLVGLRSKTSLNNANVLYVGTGKGKPCNSAPFGNDDRQPDQALTEFKEALEASERSSHHPGSG